MSLLYRAVWQDHRADLCEVAHRRFQQWLDSKGIDVRVPDEGHAESKVDRPGVEVAGCEINVRRALAAGHDAVQIELAEERPASGDRWTTRLTAIDTPGRGEGWLWVDLERVAADATSRPLLAAPRLVRDLIDDGRDARVDQVRLFTSAQPIAASALAGLIRNQERTLPLVVFSVDRVKGFTPALARANETARRLAGAVQVMVLPLDQTDAFKGIVGGELGVWGGAARVYLPNSGPAGLRPERHRYVSPDRMGDGVDRPARIVAGLLTSVVTARRPPAAYDLVRRELRLGRSANDAVLLALAEEEIGRLTAERDRLKDELLAMEDDLLDTQVDLEEATVRGARLDNALQSMLIAGRSSAGEPGDGDGAASLVCEVADMSEALALARERLVGLVIPDAVERDLDDLDSHPNSVAWGDLAWRGLRALHVYALSGWEGNFRTWCTESGDHWVWPATDKKLALRESSSVEQNRRLAEQRRFIVDRAVDPSGAIVMWSHLKIAEGGGPLAPRIYFHDDTRGVTGKVHVGYVGPHRHLENTKTN